MAAPVSARRIDVAVALVLAVATLLLLLPYAEVSMRTLRGDHSMGADELTYLANADRVRRGETLYRDIFEFRGPLPLAVPFLAFLVGKPGVATGRVAMIIFVALWTGLMYATARRIGGGRIAGIMMAAFVPLFVWPTWPYAYYDFVAQAFLCAALLFGAGARPSQSARWRLSGACLAGALWSHVAQGIPVMIAFSAVAALAAYSLGTARDARAVLRDIGIGVGAVSGAVLLALIATGALQPALRSIFLFPFQSYHATPYNVTRYGVDRAQFLGQWRAQGTFAGFAVKLIVDTALVLPRLSVVVSGLIGVKLIVLAARRLLQGPSESVQRSAHGMRRVGLSASLAAASLPVFFNLTRSDLCHLGFVETTSLLAVAGVVLDRGAASSSRWGDRIRLLSTWGRRSAGVAAALALGAGMAFTARCVTRPRPHEDTDAWARIRFDTDQVAARTRPDDTIFVAQFGGWHYLYTGRRNATPYTAIFPGVYSADQWPVAARAVVERRPRLLILNHDMLRELTQRQPRIKNMYFGTDGNYILDERRPGPALSPGAPWSITRRQGASLQRLSPVDFQATTGSARLQVWLPTAGGSRRLVLGSLDGDLLCIFDGADMYVGHIAASGTRIEGQVFKGGRSLVTFDAVPIPRAETPAGLQIRAQ
jgi:hypothetical protein